MSDAHRGPAQEDQALFAVDQHEKLRSAVADLSWLLGRGYAAASALELVGNRHGLTSWQRKAVSRAACTDRERAARRRKRARSVRGRELHLDGLNVLITGESLAGGAPVFRGRDGALRDLASVHGSWRRVRQTGAVIACLGEKIKTARSITWWLDRPVGNSGRLRAMLLEIAAERGWRWKVELAADPDRVLVGVAGVVATADARILDACESWIDLPRTLATERAWIIDLA